MRYRLKVATWMVVREGDEPSPHFLRTSADIARLALDLVRDSDDDREHFWALILDGKNRLKLAFQVSVGSLNASIVHPREVFGPALREGASAIAIVHNHPSGDPTPSAEDIEVTRRLVKGGELLGVRLLDHVIVGNGPPPERWTSFQERGILTAP